MDRFLAEASVSNLHCSDQTGSETHRALYLDSTGKCFLEGTERDAKLNIRPDPSDFKMSGATPPLLHTLLLHKQGKL